MERFESFRTYSDDCTYIKNMLKGYLKCALWLSTDDNECPLDKNYDIENISDISFSDALEDCENFIDLARTIPVNNSNLWDALQWFTPNNEKCSAEENIGHNFWLTRCGHGTGFWDREYLPEEIQNLATEMSEKLGPKYLYVGDDGQLWLM